jgi:hypothetical protein
MRLSDVPAFVFAFVPFGARVAFVCACGVVVLLAAIVDRGDP